VFAALFFLFCHFCFATPPIFFSFFLFFFFVVFQTFCMGLVCVDLNHACEAKAGVEPRVHPTGGAAAAAVAGGASDRITAIESLCVGCLNQEKMSVCCWCGVVFRLFVCGCSDCLCVLWICCGCVRVRADGCATGKAHLQVCHRANHCRGYSIRRFMGRVPVHRQLQE
jgi:hypothetical protein